MGAYRRPKNGKVTDYLSVKLHGGERCRKFDEACRVRNVDYSTFLIQMVDDWFTGHEYDGLTRDQLIEIITRMKGDKKRGCGSHKAAEGKV